ncbi:MAG TPA: TIGR02444 family protein [Methylomirabilota bacterium]|nr:TIGR02444 family protein [Methylomirabilota bacterium]
MSASEVGGAEFPFWSFSVELYERPGVAPACLALQDRFGCDVNLLLFALWAGRCGAAVGPEEFARLDAAVAPWRSRVVEPIRALRRLLKSEGLGATPGLAEACRQALLKAELEAERAAQELLARTARLPRPAREPDRNRARANLDAYLGWHGVDSATARQLAATVLAAL